MKIHIACAVGLISNVGKSKPTENVICLKMIHWCQDISSRNLKKKSKKKAQVNLISCACLWSCHIIGLRIVFHVTQETITTFSFLCRYPANQVGSLIGLQSLTAAVTALLQYPIFVLIERVLGNDPFYVSNQPFVVLEN